MNIKCYSEKFTKKKKLIINIIMEIEKSFIFKLRIVFYINIYIKSRTNKINRRTDLANKKKINLIIF